MLLNKISLSSSELKIRVQKNRFLLYDPMFSESNDSQINLKANLNNTNFVKKFTLLNPKPKKQSKNSPKITFSFQK